jgi:hypothetical protein
LANLTSMRHSRAAGLRRALGLVLIGGLCAAAVTFYREGPQLPRSAPEPSSTMPSSPAAEQSVPTPSPAPSSSQPKPPARTPSLSHAKLPKGPGTTEPGILLLASPLSDGSFDIAEMVLLPAATSSLRLGPPELTLAGNRFAKSKPVAAQVQVSAGDQPVIVPNGRVSRGTNIAWMAPAKRIELRYNLRGVTVRSIPSRAGRAVAAIGPLVTAVPQDLRVAMMVPGSTVLNIECPARQLPESACSLGRQPRIRVKGTLDHNKAIIVVQFDVPRPQ